MKRGSVVVSLVCGVSLAFLLTRQTATGTILTFETKDGPFPSNTEIVQEYGDRVASALQNGYAYGQVEEGFTPNVLVEYSVLDPGGQDGTDQHFEVLEGFGDLGAALGDFESFDMSGQVIFTPEPGFLVHLNSFDVTTWDAGQSGTIQVFGQEGNETFDIADLGVNEHELLSFSSMQGTSDTPIRISSGDFGTLGIDNINFSQSVIPEPSMLALWSIFGVGCGWLVWRRRLSA